MSMSPASAIRARYKAVCQWTAENRKDIILAILLFLVAMLGFALGYLTNREAQHTPIIIERCGLTNGESSR